MEENSYNYKIEKVNSSALTIVFEFKESARNKVALIQFSKENIVYDKFYLPIETEETFYITLHTTLKFESTIDYVADIFKNYVYGLMGLSLLIGALLIWINASTRFWILWEYFQLFNLILYVSIDISDSPTKIIKTYRLANF